MAITTKTEGRAVAAGVQLDSSPCDIRTTGETLYGRRWQTELAAALGVSPRAIVYWLAGERQCPADMAERLARIVDARIRALVALRNLLGESE